MTPLTLEDFPHRDFDKLRFRDTDRMGHVNNAVFVTMLETGRSSLVGNLHGFDPEPGFSMVIARLCIDYLREILWPGTVEIGTGVIAIGRSSITMRQGLFQHGTCVATADSVLVQVDAATHRSTPIDDASRAALQALLLPV